MLSFVLRRLASGIALVIVISAVTFLLLYASGGDIARRILGPTASAEAVTQRADELGLNRPLLAQFGDWVSKAVTGNFGTSWFTSEPVMNSILGRLGVTLTLVVGATILTAIVSVILGTLAARRGGWVDGGVQVLAVLGFAIPNFLVAIALVAVFAIGLKWFKPTGFIPFSEDPAGWIATITLPILALAIGSIAGITQQIRGSMIDALNLDYVRTLRSRGLSENRVIYQHVLRNAGGPALAVLAVQFVALFSGAVIIEQILAIPGLGQVSVTATSQGDVPTVMGLVLAMAVIVVVVNLVVDLLQGFLNPKVRQS